MRTSRHHVFSLSAAVVFALTSALAVGCAGGSELDVADHHEHGDGDDGRVASVGIALSATDTVAMAISSNACATNVVQGLSLQLVQEIQCLRPNTLTKISGVAGVSLGSSVIPYLQTKTATALFAAQKARGTTMAINSALRTLPQQYLLYRWYQTGRCGISLAASPGTSNHEGALAVDIEDNAGWRASLQGKGFQWLGASDPVHYDFVGGGTVDLKGLSVKAFQRLWNRNHPADLLVEDGDFGAGTSSRLSQSPIGGFAKGADCTQVADAGSDAEAPTPPPAATTNSSPLPVQGEGDQGGNVAPTNESASHGPETKPAVEESGCAVGVAGGGSRTDGSALALALGFMGIALSRSRKRPARPALSSRK